MVFCSWRLCCLATLQFVRTGVHSWACLGAGEHALHSFGANQGLVVGPHSCLIVDSGFHRQTARRILGRAKQQSKHFIVLNSHYHSDHVFGNSVFASDGASVIAHENCRRKMLRSSKRLLASYARRDPRLKKLLNGVSVSYPSITYRDRLQVHLGDDLLADVIHPDRRAHTDGDSLVFVRKDRVLFAGDILWVGYHPNLEDADVPGQIRALKMILTLNPRKVVPGHGPVCGHREVNRFIRYLEEFDANSEKALKEGLKGDQLVRRVIPSWSWDWKMRWLMESYLQDIARRNK